MKVLIDVPEIVYHMVMNTGTFGCYRFKTAKAIREGVAFSEDATNGDVIKTIFPDTEYIYDPTYVTSKEDDHAFTIEWWNAPYKAESEVSE